MKTILLLIPVLLVASCAPKALPVIATPVRTVEVAPKAKLVRPSLERVGEKAGELKGQLDTLSGEAARARVEADQATAEAKRLADQGTATKAELDGMWKSLQSLSARNLFLETELATAKKTIGELQTSRDEAAGYLADTIEAAGIGDAAQWGLEEQSKLLQTRIANDDKALKKKEAKLSSLQNSLKHWRRAAIICGLVLLVQLASFLRRFVP